MDNCLRCLEIKFQLSALGLQSISLAFIYTDFLCSPLLLIKNIFHYGLHIILSKQIEEWYNLSSPWMRRGDKNQKNDVYTKSIGQKVTEISQVQNCSFHGSL